jgi:hypothetical protein
MMATPDRRMRALEKRHSNQTPHKNPEKFSAPIQEADETAGASLSVIAWRA